MNLPMTYDLRNAEKALPARVRKSIEDSRSLLKWKTGDGKTLKRLDAFER